MTHFKFIESAIRFKCFNFMFFCHSFGIESVLKTHSVSLSRSVFIGNFSTVLKSLRLHVYSQNLYMKMFWIVFSFYKHLNDIWCKCAEVKTRNCVFPWCFGMWKQVKSVIILLIFWSGGYTYSYISFHSCRLRWWQQQRRDAHIKREKKRTREVRKMTNNFLQRSQLTVNNYFSVWVRRVAVPFFLLRGSMKTHSYSFEWDDSFWKSFSIFTIEDENRWGWDDWLHT